MAEEFDWKFPVTLSNLPPRETAFELVPDEAARAWLARRAGVPAIPRLIARLKVQPEGREGAAVQGSIEATVRQTCVVTLESFDNEIHEPIALRFEPAEAVAARPPQAEEVVGEDPPEPLTDGTLDLAAVVAEFLILSIDPYPRRPGAVFSPPGAAEGGKEPSPFAALANLKLGPDGKKQ